MTTSDSEQVLHLLNNHREDLIHRITEFLFANVPLVGISEHDEEPQTHHHRNMHTTAERFHDMVQTGGSIDWSLAAAEFAWAGRKLPQWGVKRRHFSMLIDSYFSEAAKLRDWSAEERQVLDDLAAHLREAAQVWQEEPEQPAAVGA